MKEFDLTTSIALYTSRLCRGIRSRRERRETAREYAEHIEDSVYHYTLTGMTEEQAFNKACEDIGSAELCSELLCGVHNSKNPAEDIDLPEDIRRYVKQNIIKRLWICALVVVLDIAAYFVCNRYFIDNLGFINMVAIFAAAGFCGISATGIFKYIFDRSWCGEVIKVEVETVKGINYVTNVCTQYEENVILLYVKKPNGKIIIHEAMRLGIGMDTPYRRMRAYTDKYINVGKIEYEVKNYSVGDRIYHFYGLPHLFVHHIEDMSRVNCVICGMKNPVENKVCGECGHTLITQEIIE